MQRHGTSHSRLNQGGEASAINMAMRLIAKLKLKPSHRQSVQSESSFPEQIGAWALQAASLKKNVIFAYSKQRRRD
jgi:hypothetical protein